MFIINGKKFSGELTFVMLDEILSEIKKLPKPVVGSMSSSITEENTVLCLQREVAYVDLKNPLNHKIQYVGSKGVHDCIVAYLSTETDHLVVHVDRIKYDMELKERLKQFTEKKKMQLSLAGGSPDPHTASQSYETLKFFLISLYRCAEELEIEIKIANQKLIENNESTDDAKYQFIYDFILRQTDILSRQVYGVSFSSDEFRDFNPSLFQTRKLPALARDITNIARLLAKLTKQRLAAQTNP